MKALFEEYGDAILAVMIVILILTVVYHILPMLSDLTGPFLETLIG